MKNKKKRNKKHTTRNDFGYTPGRNMFGEKAETHLIVLKRETALQQVIDAICQLDGSTKEFTFDCSCFIGHEEEHDEVMAKARSFMMFRAAMQKQPFYDISALMDKAS